VRYVLQASSCRSFNETASESPRLEFKNVQQSKGYKKTCRVFRTNLISLGSNLSTYKRWMSRRCYDRSQNVTEAWLTILAVLRFVSAQPPLSMRFSNPLVSFFLVSTLSLVSASNSKKDQIPMASGSNPPEYFPQTTPQPTLADLLTIEPSASIFYSYARELELSSMLSDHDAKFTVFVPTNKAVMALARKPSVAVKLSFSGMYS